ncbi:uncharacterized protein [Solanum lycopersicum]|uniref:uncharacterized protein n=1 Tax=Solanum lycopersicum TaxID=4081 RepID=UPI00374A4325
MKRDIVDFVAQCPDCQQVKYEHQRPGGTLQRKPIPKWKWEKIAMDFVVGLPMTLGRFDSIWETLLAAQSRQKEYADQKVRDFDFMEGEQVLLKVSPMKGVMRFGKRGKLSPRYISPFEVVKRVGDVAYELELTPGLSGVHPVFHVSMLKKYHSDGNYIICWDSILLDENLSYEEEPIAILDREVRQLRPKEVISINVQWKNPLVEENTWENEADMQERYPHLFTDSSTLSRPCFSSCDRSRTNDG